MRNIDKLIKFLITDSDKEMLCKSTAIDNESVNSFCDFIIEKILPEDFIIQYGSHVEEKDLNSLVRNFNSLLKEENLKEVLVEGIRKTGVKPSQASKLATSILPIIHEKIKILMKNASGKKEEKEVSEAFASKLSEPVKAYEEPVNETEVKEQAEPSSLKEEEVIEDIKEEHEGSSTVDKVLMAVIAVCFLAIIGVLVFILVKVNLG